MSHDLRFDARALVQPQIPDDLGLESYIHAIALETMVYILYQYVYHV